MHCYERFVETGVCLVSEGLECSLVRKNQVCRLGCCGHEDVADKEEVQLSQCFEGPAGICIDKNRVRMVDDHRPGCIGIAGQKAFLDGGEGDVPEKRVFVFLLHCRRVEVVDGSLRDERKEDKTSLSVNPSRNPAERSHCLDRIDRVRIHVQAVSFAYGCTLCLGEILCNSGHKTCRDTGDRLGIFRCEFLYSGLELIEPDRVILHEVKVIKVIVDDVPEHSHGKHDVGTGFDLDPKIAVFNRFALHWINEYYLGSSVAGTVQHHLYSVEGAVSAHPVGGLGVAPPEDDVTGIVEIRFRLASDGIDESRDPGNHAVCGGSGCIGATHDSHEIVETVSGIIAYWGARAPHYGIRAVFIQNRG